MRGQECKAANFSDGWSRWHEGPPGALELLENFERYEGDPLRWLTV